jgi:hypothetical protein
MIIPKKSILIAILALAFIFSTTYGQQSEQLKRQLHFESSGIFKPTRHFSEVTHYGYFHIVEDRSIRENWTDEWITLSSQWKVMSEKQRQFIDKLNNDYQYRSIVREKGIARPFSIQSDYVKTPEGTRTYCVLAVSKEDVQKMAEAVIERYDNQAHARLEGSKKTLQKNLKIISEAEKMIPKLEKEFKQLDKQLTEKSEEYLKTNYEVGKKKIIEIYQHAQKNMEELARYMKLAKFELIGLHARINSIEKFKAGGIISDPGTLIKLDQMLISDQIEEAGVLARISAYEEAFKQAKTMYDVINSYSSIEVQKRGWDDRLKKAQKEINVREKILANPPAYTQPVQVHENKIMIWQVK